MDDGVNKKKQGFSDFEQTIPLTSMFSNYSSLKYEQIVTHSSSYVLQVVVGNISMQKKHAWVCMKILGILYSPYYDLGRSISILSCM